MGPGHRGAGPSFYTCLELHPRFTSSRKTPHTLCHWSTLANLGIRQELPGKMSGRAGTRDSLHPCPVQLA